jgi:hypothetical protein
VKGEGVLTQVMGAVLWVPLGGCVVRMAWRAGTTDVSTCFLPPPYFVLRDILCSIQANGRLAKRSPRLTSGK